MRLFRKSAKPRREVEAQYFTPPRGRFFNDFVQREAPTIAPLLPAFDFLNSFDDKKERALYLAAANIRQPGVYALTDLVDPYVVPGPQSYAKYELPGIFPAIRRYYITSPTAPGSIRITRFDTVARIVSGTFEAKLREYNGPDSLSLTKGRFDCTF